MIRFFDIVISLVGLILLSPLFVLLILLILLDSKGPAIYKQKRVGKDGVDFDLYKFRSMYPNSDRNGLITIGYSDPRITRIGFQIRKYKMDELPQLLNVLWGDMSFVGPRPEVRKYVDMYTEQQREVLSVRPGITDYASISFSNENELLSNATNPDEYYFKSIMPEKLRLNMIFIKNRSLLQYFKIILLTSLHVFNIDGKYQKQ